MQNASNNNKQCFEKYVLTVCLWNFELWP